MTSSIPQYTDGRRSFYREPFVLDPDWDDLFVPPTVLATMLNGNDALLSYTGKTLVPARREMIARKAKARRDNKRRRLAAERAAEREVRRAAIETVREQHARLQADSYLLDRAMVLVGKRAGPPYPEACKRAARRFADFRAGVARGTAPWIGYYPL